MESNSEKGKEGVGIPVEATVALSTASPQRITASGLSVPIADATLADDDSGAKFSECRRYRYALWRIWDRSKPFVMVIGLNPSTANEVDADPTIRSVGRIARANGFGGFYMVNCFAYISTDPNQLRDFGNTALNDHILYMVSRKCGAVVFAWGAFPIVPELGRDIELTSMFPGAKAIHINKNGSPKHPLYCKSTTQFVPWVLRHAIEAVSPEATKEPRTMSEERGAPSSEQTPKHT